MVESRLLQLAVCLLTLVALTSAQAADYELIPGHGYYKLHTVDRSWTQAVTICQDEGAHLLIVNSQAEIDAIYNKYLNLGIWVGVHRVGSVDNFVTIFDEPLESTGYSTWYSGFPRGDLETWPYVGVSKNEGLYNLFSTVILNFVCEVELK